jgi:RimJ/RimL family protein N-acetyltransferase
METMSTEVSLRPWAEGDLPLLVQLMSDPEMMEHLGGPEAREKIEERHLRYLSGQPGNNQMFVIVVGADKAAAGSIGYWERVWRGETVWVTGWSVLPAWQGRGIATAATRQVIRLAREGGRHRFLHAYPSTDNPPSNAICRKAGFSFGGEADFEYPPGNPIRCNDWYVDLTR